MFKLLFIIKETIIMNLQNGYKVIYEVAADGKRTFYATKSNVYPNTEDTVLASFNDADYVGKVIYEYKGAFYVSTGSVPAYDENGVPTDTKIAGFDKVFVADESVPANVPAGDENTSGNDDNGEDVGTENGDDAGDAGDGDE